MTRIIYKRKKKLTTEERKDRAKKYRVSRYGVWVDPFPNIMGTRPEKMVFAELVRRQIPFQYQNWFYVDLIGLVGNRWYRPDFIIPNYKIIIEVQGAYWHSQPKAIESDAYKYTLYELMGWKVLTWWDYEIEDDLGALFAKTPELNSYKYKGTYTLYKKQYDDSAGIRKMNEAKRKPWTKKPVGVKSKQKRKKRKVVYNVG